MVCGWEKLEGEVGALRFHGFDNYVREWNEHFEDFEASLNKDVSSLNADFQGSHEKLANITEKNRELLSLLIEKEKISNERTTELERVQDDVNKTKADLRSSKKIGEENRRVLEELREKEKNLKAQKESWTLRLRFYLTTFLRATNIICSWVADDPLDKFKFELRTGEGWILCELDEFDLNKNWENLRNKDRGFDDAVSRLARDASVQLIQEPPLNHGKKVERRKIPERGPEPPDQKVSASQASRASVGI